MITAEVGEEQDNLKNKKGLYMSESSRSRALFVTLPNWKAQCDTVVNYIINHKTRSNHWIKNKRGKTKNSSRSKETEITYIWFAFSNSCDVLVIFKLYLLCVAERIVIR